MWVVDIRQELPSVSISVETRFWDDYNDALQCKNDFFKALRQKQIMFGFMPEVYIYQCTAMNMLPVGLTVEKYLNEGKQAIVYDIDGDYLTPQIEGTGWIYEPLISGDWLISQDANQQFYQQTMDNDADIDGYDNGLNDWVTSK